MAKALRPWQHVHQTADKVVASWSLVKRRLPEAFLRWGKPSGLPAAKDHTNPLVLDGRSPLLDNGSGLALSILLSEASLLPLGVLWRLMAALRLPLLLSSCGSTARTSQASVGVMSSRGA